MIAFGLFVLAVQVAGQSSPAWLFPEFFEASSSTVVGGTTTSGIDGNVHTGIVAPNGMVFSGGSLLTVVAADYSSAEVVSSPNFGFGIYAFAFDSAATPPRTVIGSALGIHLYDGSYDSMSSATVTQVTSAGESFSVAVVPSDAFSPYAGHVVGVVTFGVNQFLRWDSSLSLVNDVASGEVINGVTFSFDQLEGLALSNDYSVAYMSDYGVGALYWVALDKSTAGKVDTAGLGISLDKALKILVRSNGNVLVCGSAGVFEFSSDLTTLVRSITGAAFAPIITGGTDAGGAISMDFDSNEHLYVVGTDTGVHIFNEDFSETLEIDASHVWTSGQSGVNFQQIGYLSINAISVTGNRMVVTREFEQIYIMGAAEFSEVVEGDTPGSVGDPILVDFAGHHFMGGARSNTEYLLYRSQDESEAITMTTGATKGVEHGYFTVAISIERAGCGSLHITAGSEHTAETSGDACMTARIARGDEGLVLVPIGEGGDTGSVLAVYPHQQGDSVAFLNMRLLATTPAFRAGCTGMLCNEGHADIVA